jgi:hypothetical protein
LRETRGSELIASAQRQKRHTRSTCGSQTKMLSSTLARRTPAVVAALRSSVAPAFTALNAEPRSLIENATQRQQVRSMVTKKRIHRQEKRKRKEDLAAKGISLPRPNNYIPKDAPVINAVSREKRDAESKRSDELAAQELKTRMDVVEAPLLRFGFTEKGLVMSDRVKKLLDLQNGNQKEVIKAQKKRGMELFQVREGDTGSSAVQGKYFATNPITFFDLED